MAQAPDAVPASSDVLIELVTTTSLFMFVLGPYDDGLPLLWVNDAFAEKTGLLAGEPPPTGPDRTPLGALGSVLTDPVDAEMVAEALARQEGGSFTVQCAGAGGAYWGNLNFTPRRDAAGRVTHFLGICTDVSGYIDEQSAQLHTLALERRQRADLGLVAKSTELLADLDYPYALRDIAELLRSVVPWAAFYLHDDGLFYAEGIDVAAPPGGRRRHVRSSGAGRAGLPHVAARAVPDTVQDLLDGVVDGPVQVRLDVEYPPYTASAWLSRDLTDRVLAETGVRPGSAVVHAVGGRRRILGLLVLWNGDKAQGGDGGSLAEMVGESADVRTVAEVLARRAGGAIDNARLYAREHHLAGALQRAMLPELADVPGLDVWTYYAPSSSHAQVGGDWYDVLDFADTGPGAVSGTVSGLVIGDVVGHDVEAAAAMGQLRSVVRAYAHELRTPGVVLDRVDQLVKVMRIPRTASLVYATLQQRISDDDSGTAPPRWDMEYTRAGHLPPLLLRDGTVRQLDGAGGSLVGFASGERSTARAELRPGDVLVFYTDGLIERRDRSLKVGLDALLAVSVGLAVCDAVGVGEELLSQLADSPEDDIALVVVRLPREDCADEVPGTRTRRWLLPNDAASIGRARHAVLRACGEWELPASATAELVVSELVANAVLHGWGNISLRLFGTGGGLRIEVEDANPAPPVTTDGHPNRVGGFGMQIVERLADWGWRPTASGKLVWARIRPGC